MKRTIAVIGALALLASSASVQETGNLSQPVNTRLTAGVGDTVLRIAKEKNLPNAFGRADVFGRKTPTGMTVVQYLGVRDGKDWFKRTLSLLKLGRPRQADYSLGLKTSA